MQQGTDFRAELTLSNNGAMGEIKNIAITQLVPSGWEIVNTRVGDIVQTGNYSTPDYMDIRDDRVMLYTGLKADESKIFNILLNASYAGTYYLPSVTAEAMYDNRALARKKGTWVKVVK